MKKVIIILITALMVEACIKEDVINVTPVTATEVTNEPGVGYGDENNS